MQQSIVKFYYFAVQTLLNMFRALLCPLSGARQTAVAASGFRMNVEVDVLRLIVASSWVFYLSEQRGTEPQTLNIVLQYIYLFLLRVNICHNYNKSLCLVM
jgi:hypothetical protein